jgi:hypothetical protein
MPSKPPVFRANHLPSPKQAAKLYEQERRCQQPMRTAYYTTRWRQLRAHILRQTPLCAECNRQGRVIAANTIDNRELLVARTNYFSSAAGGIRKSQRLRSRTGRQHRRYSREIRKTFFCSYQRRLRNGFRGMR